MAANRIASDRTKLRQLAKTAKLDVDAVLASTRVAIELVPRPLGTRAPKSPTYDALPGAECRFGGVPDFPEGDGDWPGELRFVVGLNLGEIALRAKIDLETIGLPNGGLLNCFVSDGEDDDGDYLGTGYVQFDKAFSVMWRLPVPETTVTPCFGMQWVPRLTIPHPGATECKVLKLRGEQVDAYNDIVYAGMPRPKHQLCGYKTTDLDDESDEVLLLSLDSDKRLKWKWGDGNRLNFLIKKRHLAKGKLEEAFPFYVDA